MVSISSLKKNKNLIVKNSDKGGSVVVLDAALYKNQVLSILIDANTYRILDQDTTPLFMIQLKQLLEEGLALGT